MSPDEKKEVKKLWTMLATYYGREVMDQVIMMYTEDVADMPFEAVKRAMHEYRRGPRNRTMPLPADIRQIAQPEAIGDELLAVDAAARILHAMVKFGYPNWKAAQEYIGTLGWMVVQKQGGWEQLCQSTKADDRLTFQKQARDIARSEIAIARTRRLPALGEGHGLELPSGDE